ncbi:ankyrin repeat protein [Annulohypoxylon maeteangense]|uniref:ankyrin repeat protein n=1 Tax=Annulohypoxylon maeteangense TaxID=1927788 RepID=UPI0020084CC9|nr:ankyrin repeat protein [Annulohypoxylon maeteangense]KAI0889471.1 ankyrin repeat protein [Annulohypoxylon maeteangense]
MAVSALPKLPVAHDVLANYIANHPKTPVRELMDPYRKFEAQLREMYAQERNNPVLDDPYVNVLPLFTKDTPNIKTRARNLEAESPSEKEKYIMSLPDDKRRPNDSPAVVSSLKEFRHNFGVFSESSLVEMNWSNVIAAGSSVVNCLLPVPDQYKKSKRALRNYYHEKFCPASDVDLFLYGLSEEQAVEKIKEIEARIRDAILSEVTVVRTKNAITICSQYPTRHVQIVLRVYKSISEILTGFDIDCSGAAYDGSQVYCTPRALASYITQINPIDLTRRSPSYENRLSKYSHRNFEVYWQELDRSRIDPTIFERSFHRTLGLARLLVLERLPTTNARDEYLRKRREERGRPQLDNRFQYRIRGNIKDIHEDEVADWVDESEVSNYHTFSIPYGEKFHAKKIEKLCYTKDLLLNAEWNQPKEREVYLHRHPAFFGRVEDVIGDCCGTCPKPHTAEEFEVFEKESAIYVSGKVTFRIDDPGRQQIGSFNPLTDDDWTEMAYVGNTARLCQAIVDGDIEHVEDWLSQEGADPNKRDYTGRTPLHLAVISSTPQVVKCLVDRGARLVSRLADGRSALHLAAARGDVEMVRILLEKSESNEEDEEEKQDQRRKARSTVNNGNEVDKIDQKATATKSDNKPDDEDSEADLVSDASSEDGNDAISIATGSFVKIGKDGETEEKDAAILDEDTSEPDFYKVDAVAWDSKCSALHYAIVGGHCEVVKLLCQEFGSDVISPVKIGDGSYSSPNVAILTMVLALALPVEKALRMAETLLSLGATSSQADADSITAFHRYIQSGPPELVECLWNKDKIGVKAALNHVSVTGSFYSSEVTTPLSTAIDNGDPILVLKLLEAGAKPQIDFDSWLKGAKFAFEGQLRDYENNVARYKDATEQPLVIAIKSLHPSNAIELLERGADPNTLTRASHNVISNDWSRKYHKGRSVLDVVHDLLKEYWDFRNNLTGTPETGRKPGFYAPKKGIYVERPAEPFGTTEFLSKFTEGTYTHYLVSTDIADRTNNYKKQLEKFEKEQAESVAEEELTEMDETTQDLISQLERVLELLVSKGAKTFREQYPDIQDPPESPKESSEDRSSLPYTLEIKFPHATDVTDARKDAYIRLFEAAWTGDLEVIKSLTLASWGVDGQESPLKMAVSDMKGNNPFSLAFLRGHYEVSKAILEIAQAQWAPKSDKTTRFTMNKDVNDEYYSCEESESDDGDEVEVYKRVIDDQFTIENVGQVSTQVKSQVLASALLDWEVPTFVSCDGSFKAKERKTLLQFVISENDAKGFDFLINLNVHFAREEPVGDDNDEENRFYMFPQRYFDHALWLGRTEMLASVIRRIGAGIPIEDLVKKSGTELNVKPRYYQGLSVYGKKRSDWAKAGRNLVVKATGSKIPPLLSAALQGSLESIEWFVSDTPMRHYVEFGKSKVAKEDVRLKHLTEASGGFDRAISKWLGVQNDLVIHCAVMGPRGEKTNKLIEYLIKVCPSSFEAKSDEGYTPLYLACLLGRVQFAKTLINAGADQSVKDKDFNNVIHAALTNNPEPERLRELLDLLDKDLRSHMFLQRNNLTRGGDTPLHFWLKEANPVQYCWNYCRGYNTSRRELQDENTANIKILKVILELSGGAELETLNGAGDTILHTAVLRHLAGHVRVLVSQNPNVLYRENAVGRTPGEIAYDFFINSNVVDIEPVVVRLDTGNGNIKTVLLKKKGFSRDKESTDSIGQNRKEHTWQIIEEQLGKAEGKRRLVSLNEANDVAKRLGESYSWQRYFQKRRTADDEQEVEEQRGKDDEKEVDFVTTEYRLFRDTAWIDEKEDGERD